MIGAIILSINIQVGLNMHLYDDIGDASSSLWGSTSSLYMERILLSQIYSNIVFSDLWNLLTLISFILNRHSGRGLKRVPGLNSGCDVISVSREPPVKATPKTTSPRLVNVSYIEVTEMSLVFYILICITTLYLIYYS